MEKIKRTRRVGTLTAGIAMVVYGVMFILHLFIDAISYQILFRMWPLILVGLGIEILVFGCTDREYTYDKGAVFLMIIVAFFAMGMGAADLVLQYMTRSGGVISF